MEVGCGQCLGCRLDYRSMWAIRIVHEASLYEHRGGNCFVTLTYRDKLDCTLDQLEKAKHVPDDWSLNKAHWQKFMKRLRKAFPDQEIRYFYCGEYGRKCKHGIDLSRVNCPLCNTGRPHFHACLFNLNFPDLVPYESDGGIVRYTSPTLEKIWGYGFVDVGDLNYSSAAYVTGYVLKKVKANVSDHHYMTYDLNGEITWISPEFVGMSRGNAKRKGERCGIGAGWYEKWHTDVFPADHVPVPGAGIKQNVPRYYFDILKDENPAMYERIKDVRRTFMKEHGDEYTHERLLAKHKCKKARENQKIRSL